MTLISINTLTAFETSSTIETSANELETTLKRLSTQWTALSNEWSGNSKYDAEREIRYALDMLCRMVSNTSALGGKLHEIARRFDNADQAIANVVPRLVWSPVAPNASIANVFIPFFPLWPLWGRNIDLTPSFNQQWASWTTDQRLDFLKRQYSKLIAKYGLTEISVVSADLPDSFFLFIQISDTKGQFIGDKIEIDIDNLNSADGLAMLTTLIHETRHQIQFEMASRYEKDGDQAQFPPGITLEQARTWYENFNNYKQPADDYEAYRNQPLESDARGFAEENINEYADTAESA